jgi:adenylate cyclase
VCTARSARALPHGRADDSVCDTFARMGTEIERKFLVTSDAWRGAGTSSRIRQAYLARSKERSVRVRDEDGQVTVTIKGPDALERTEFEYAVPKGDADGLFALCEPGAIDKTRHRIPVGKHIWEVDEFHGAHQGLVLAEIELGHVGESVDLPAWVGEEVTGKSEYTNAALSRVTLPR